MRRMLGVLSVVVLAACATDAPQEARTEPIPYTLDAEGIQLADRPQRIDFGRTDHSVIPAMTKLVGQGPTRQGSCASGGQFVVWPDRTTLFFLAGAFRGWVTAGEDGVMAQAGLICA